nr:MAG: ORF1 [TTV-like mini virus]
MPPYNFYWRRQNYNRWRRQRRRRYRRRRFRRPLQRRFRRRRWVRKKRRFPKFKKKLKYLKLKQWQPKSIRTCHIKGYKTLFSAGPDRDSNNYAQYQDTIVEKHLPSGGGWSLLIFSLDGLWEEHQKVRNWWTTSNKGLPLARYIGCSFKFFRDYNVDYAVSYSLCYPMVDTEYKHANSCPYITLMAKKRFIVPSIKRKPRGKPYIRKHFPPPSQMKNKWYFQADICKTGLLLLTTTAVDLNYFDCPPWAISNNVTLNCLNPTIFKHVAFHLQSTQGYIPQPGFYYYCIPPDHHYQGNKPKIKDLSYLGGIGNLWYGEPILDNKETYFSNSNKWGNIFAPEVLNLDIPVFKTTMQFATIKDVVEQEFNILGTTNINGKGSITRVTDRFIIPVRYNPHRDTGEGNQVYIKSIDTEGNSFEPPTDKNLRIDGFPLWIALWGWLDWQKKVHWVSHIDSSYVLIAKCKFTEPELTTLTFIDDSILQGNGPYNIPKEDLTVYTKTSWYPKCAFQHVTINNICHCGPATQKYKDLKHIQAHCNYDFKFKWGGCPAPMVDLTNPCSQPKYAVPDNLIQRLQNQNPNTPPETELHDFDERRHQLTETCIKRIQDHTRTEQTLFAFAGTTDPPTTTERQKIQKALQTSPQKERKTSLLDQLQQQHQQQQLLRRAILQLMEPNLE